MPSTPTAPTDTANVIESDTAERHRITLVPEPSWKRLNERQRIDYHAHRRELVEWMLYVGKDPDRGQGYAFTTSRRRASDLDSFYRWVWDEAGYTLNITHDHADEYMRDLVFEDHSRTHKQNTRKALKMLFRWLDEPWEPEIDLPRESHRQPRDYLTKNERRLIREAALECGSIPSWNSLTAHDREEWKIILAQRFRKPTSEIGEREFQKANGFKIPTIVWTALDGGLRPIEVGRARTHWIDVENSVLRIPVEDSTKNRDNWVVSIRDRTATMLDHWLTERELYENYADTDRLWLTRESKPYSSRSLKYLLEKLCDLADIDTENRQMTWYALRHSTGTYMTREEGLAAAAAQLRHKDVQTTMKYDQTPADDRRDALDRMG